MASNVNNAWRDLMKRASDLLHEGRPREADDLLRPRLAAGDAPFQALALAGMAAHALGDAGRAADYLAHALRLAPGDAAMRYNLAVALRDAGRADEAERRSRELLADRPDHVPAAVLLAEILTERGRTSDAVQVCESVATSASPDPMLAMALGDALRLDGALDGAEAVLADAASRWPEDPRLQVRLGLLRRAQGQLQEAVQCYERANALRPDHPATLNNLGLALVSMDRLERARACFERALDLQPAFHDARLNRAAVLARQGRRSEALRDARRVVESRSASARAHATLAALLSGERDPEAHAEAETEARRALGSEPRNAVAWDSLGIALMKLDRPAEAFEAGHRAIELAPSAVDYRLHLADNLARANQLEASEKVLRRALEDLPEAPELHRQLGIVLLRTGRSADALACLDRCLRERPADQRAVAHKGIALERLGREDEARALLGLDRYIRQVRIPDVRPFDSLGEFNRQLAKDIRNHPTLRWEPVGLAASGGALTGELMDAPTEAIRVYVRELGRAIDALRADLDGSEGHPFVSRIPRNYRLNTWATLVPEQGEISSHIHEESWLSGAYYAELPAAMGEGREVREGWLEFGRPSPELPDVPDSALRYVEPEEGLLVLFPSYLFHRTLPFRGEGERISLSFDVEPLEEGQW